MVTRLLGPRIWVNLVSQCVSRHCNNQLICRASHHFDDICLGFLDQGRKGYVLRDQQVYVFQGKRWQRSRSRLDRSQSLSALCSRINFVICALSHMNMRGGTENGRLAPTCADLRRPAPTCADLRRFAPTCADQDFFFCHGPKLLRVLDTPQSLYQPRS